MIDKHTHTHTNLIVKTELNPTDESNKEKE